MRRKRAALRPLTGTIEVPGDKSISHRALMLAALAAGRSRITNCNLGRDVLATARALGSLGAVVEVDESNSLVEVEGEGWTGLIESPEVLDLENSGTSMRLLAGVCAGVEGLSVLTGDDSLRKRPMLRVVVPLRQMGARIDGRAHGDLAPLAIRGGDLEGVDHELAIASAQVKSALLLAGLRAGGSTKVTEPGASRDHTERMLAASGARLRRGDRWTEVEPTAALDAMDRRVPGDVSSAIFLVVAAATIPGSDLTISGVGLNPTRTGALDVLRRMGADLTYEVEGDAGGEPTGSIVVRSSELHGATIDGAELPSLIDEVPALAVAATQADGPTVIADAAELRVKESDRLRALASELGKLGANVQETGDGLAIEGPTTLHSAEVESFGDHRIALAMATAGTLSGENVRVAGWSCVDTSFPEFLDVLGEARAGKS